MKLPVILQGEANECGLACLCMLLNAFGQRISLGKLRAESNNGARLSLESLSHLADRHGLATRALRCEPEDLLTLQQPAIVHLDFEHYAVLARASRGGVKLHDPAIGIVELSWQAFNRRFTGIVLSCTPLTTFKPGGDRQSGPVTRILSRLSYREITPGLAGLLALSVVTHLLMLLTPYYLQLVVDQVILLSNTDLINILTLGFLLVYVIAAMTRMLRGLLIVQIGSHLAYHLNAGLMGKLLKLPLPYFARRRIGDFSSRFASLGPVQSFLSQGLISLVLDGLLMAMTLGLLLVMVPTVAATVAGLTLAFLLTQWLMLKPYQRFSQEQVIADARLQSEFVETVTAIEVIRRNQMPGRRMGTWNNRLMETITPQVRAGQWETGIDTARFLLGGLLTLSVVYLASREILAGSMSVGALYTLVAYAGHFATAAINCSMQWQSLALLSLHAQRLTDITEHPDDSRHPLPLVEAAREICFSCVSFSHAGQQVQPLISDLSLRLNNCRKVAITGPSGSGKSSLLSLLLGDLKPTRGEISINDQPLYDDTDPSPFMAVMHQNDSLLDGTIADNITLAEESPDTRRMIEAAQSACLHEDILRLPMGYGEKVSISEGLSNGQRQRLLIARALYRRADILLMDEPTSHLDQQTEKKVMSNIMRRAQLCLFITHRPAVAAMADIEIRLPGLDIIEHGRHRRSTGEAQG